MSMVDTLCAMKVYWSKRSQSSSSIFVNDKKQIIPNDQLSLRLSDLDPDSTYYVQVTTAVLHVMNNNCTLYIDTAFI